MKKVYLLYLLSIFLISCQDDIDDYQVAKSELDIRLEQLLLEKSQGEGIHFFILPESDDFNAIPQDPLNPITREKVALGKLLLHETATGGNPRMDIMARTYACASCHPVASSFYSGRRQGIGECGSGFGSSGESRTFDLTVPIDSVDIQPIRVPTLLNVAYQDVALWNGMLGGTGTNAGTQAQWGIIPENNLGFQGLEIQGMVGQDTHRLEIDENFVDTYGYRELFDRAFSDVQQSERYSRQTAALALAAFNRTLLSNYSPWQDYLKGDYTALSEKEKRGAILFAGKGECMNCHSGPALKDQEFHAYGFGHFDDSNDALILDDAGFDNVKKGRGGFTDNPADDYKFKTPTLYNLKDASFYGHGGTFNSIEEVVRYKLSDQLQDSNVPLSQIAAEKGSAVLTEDEILDLVYFIEKSLYDSYLNRYAPESVLSGNCFPNADEQSKVDLGCE